MNPNHAHEGSLTLNHTTLREWPFENIVLKEENAAIFSFPTLFSILHKTNFNCWVTFILLSANVVSLDWSKIFLFGRELTFYHTIPILNNPGKESF